MNEPYIPVSAQTYDITIDLSGDKVSLIGLDQSEIFKFMSLMPKIFVTRYDKKLKAPNWVMSLHEKETDGSDNE